MQKIINYLLSVLILFNVFFVTVGAFLYPLASIDAVSIWLLKAKAIYFVHGVLPVNILNNSIYLNTHPQYPVLIPYLYSFFYFLFGSVKENIVGFLNPLFYLLIVFIIYKFLRKMKFSQTLALLFTYIYSMLSPFLAQGGRKHAGDADIFIVFVNWLTLFLSYLFFKNKSYKILSLIIILVMISSQIKGEGVFLASIILFLPIKRKVKFLSLAVSLIPFLIWRGIIAYYKIPNDFYFLIPPLREIAVRVFQIFYYTLREMIKINNWYIFWPVFACFAALVKSKDNFINKVVLPSLGLISAALFIFYLFLSVSPALYVPPSIDRILLQLSPFYFLLFVVLVKTALFPEAKRTKKS